MVAGNGELDVGSFQHSTQKLRGQPSSFSDMGAPDTARPGGPAGSSGTAFINYVHVYYFKPASKPLSTTCFWSGRTSGTSPNHLTAMHAMARTSASKGSGQGEGAAPPSPEARHRRTFCRFVKWLSWY